MAKTLYIKNYNLNKKISYIQDNYLYTFTEYNLDKRHYYDNIDNIIPNPLYNNIINYKYVSYGFATSDLNGEQNTQYLKRNQHNVSNILSDNFYIPSIGELGISMENIQLINDSIENLGSEYEKYKIDNNKIYVSSTLHSNENIYNKEYQITNNLNNVWNFNTNNAKISYNLISNNYNVLSFYRFDTNILTELELHNEDIVLNSLNSIDDDILEVNNKKYYYENNIPIDINYDNVLNKKTYIYAYNINNELYCYATYIDNITYFNQKHYDYNLEFWKLNPFSSKYFYIILNPECKQIIQNNFYNYYQSFKDNNNLIKLNITDLNNNSYSYTYSWNTDNTRIGYITNNGVDFIPDYIKTTDNGFINNYMSSYTYLYYNLPIYGNNIVFVPIYGSGENNYNIKKYNPICEFYLVVPKLIDYLLIKINDCIVTKRIFLELGQFNIYYIKLVFKTNYPTSNIIEFIARYKSVNYSRKYYFSIYSFNISNILSSDNNLATYIDINNYYVAKHSYGWWFNQYDTIGLSSNKINGKFCNSNINISEDEQHNKIYELPELYNNFLRYNSDNFESNYDLSLLVNNISRSLNIGNGTSVNRGLRVERMIDKDTILSYQYSENNNNGFLFIYNEQISSTENSEEIKSYKFINSDTNYSLLENNWWLFKYSKYNDITKKYELTNNYHLLNINTYNYYNNSLNKLISCNSENTANESNGIIFNNNLTYNNSLAYYYSYNSLLNYTPILRLYRTKDEYGIHNDLIFAYFYNSFTEYKYPSYLNYFNEENVFNSYNCPIERYIDKVKDPFNSSNVYIRYLNKFNLNIPIVSAKQFLCLNMDLNDKLLKLFRDKSKHYYLYSDYIFIYNSTDENIEILMDDESLSLVDNRKTVFIVKPGELKVYYPNNFNYNTTYREFKNEIYNIKLYNKSFKNIKFNIINIGNLNLDIQECIDNNIYIEDLLGYKYICYLNYLENEFKYSNKKINDKLLSDRYNLIINIYENIIKAKTKYLSDLDGYISKFTKQQVRFKPIEFFNNEIYLDDNNYIINNQNNLNNWFKSINKTSTDYAPILSEYIEDKKIDFNNRVYQYDLSQNKKYFGIDNVNIIIKHNLDHIINLEELDLSETFDNYVNISIKDYSLNKAGYLIILKNS